MTEEEKDRFFKIYSKAKVLLKDCNDHDAFLRYIITVIDSSKPFNKTELVERIKVHINAHPTPKTL